MIKASELRIGNWVSGQNDPPMTVMSIDKHGIEAYFFESEADNWYYEMEDVKPIPLTPEILENCGTKLKGVYGICISRDEVQLIYGIQFSIEKDSLRTSKLISVRYLHQLQNLYFALTGEELKVNLTEPQTA